MRELQRIWRNPPDQPFSVNDLTDARIDELLAETIGQIRFEKAMRAITFIVMAPIVLFVAVGVLGLLLFGFRQVLPGWF
jgi:hypothetical protein